MVWEIQGRCTAARDNTTLCFFLSLSLSTWLFLIFSSLSHSLSLPFSLSILLHLSLTPSLNLFISLSLFLSSLISLSLHSSLFSVPNGALFPFPRITWPCSTKETLPRCRTAATILNTASYTYIHTYIHTRRHWPLYHRYIKWWALKWWFANSDCSHAATVGSRTVLSCLWPSDLGREITVLYIYIYIYICVSVCGVMDTSVDKTARMEKPIDFFFFDPIKAPQKQPTHLLTRMVLRMPRAQLINRVFSILKPSFPMKCLHPTPRATLKMTVTGILEMKIGWSPLLYR